MAIEDRAGAINNFLGSAHLFATAVHQILESQLWRETVGKKVSLTQLKLLKLLGLTGSHTVSDVATFLGVSKAAASKAVDKMVKYMLISRCEGDQDRRTILLSLTGHGRRILEAYEQSAQRKMLEVFGPFNPDELRNVEDLLDHLAAGIINHRAARGGLCVHCGIYFRDNCRLKQELGRRCLYSSPGISRQPAPPSKDVPASENQLPPADGEDRSGC